MSYDLHDTIAAVATASGGAARGIVRISGPDAMEIAARFFTPENGQPLCELRRALAVPGHVQILLAWRASPRRPKGVIDPPLPAVAAATLGRGPHIVPCVLFAWPNERSYTRQPVAELHTIGSPPVFEAVLAEACAAGARPAEPGEFTLRAFLAGRIDLTQAEAVLGVIDARGPDELDASLAQLAGGLARPLAALRDQLLQLLAELEAGLDFVEEDIQFVSRSELGERLEWSVRRLGDLTNQMASRLMAAHADQVVLLGPPNVGKSSLFNALVARHGVRILATDVSHPAALVSARRGTTRDYLTATIRWDGIRCELVDTAGIDEQSRAPMDAAAQRQAAELQTRAAIRAWCSDDTDFIEAPADCHVVVLTKADVVSHQVRSSSSSSERVPVVITSSRTGEGLDELCGLLKTLLTGEPRRQAEPVVAATARRCSESIRLAEIALRRAILLVINGDGEELVAAEVRVALTELGKVVGAVYTDDLLDRIFSSFCIGK